MIFALAYAVAHVFESVEFKLHTSVVFVQLSFFAYIFVHLRQKARLRFELSLKFLPTSGPNPPRTRPELEPKSPARFTTLICSGLRCRALF